MEDHAIIGDNGPYVDRAQEEYLENMGIGNATHELGALYSKLSTQSTMVLASKGDNTLEDITKRVGYGQRAVFNLQAAKAPDELEMCQHQGIAWVISAQATIRLYRRSKDCNPCHQ
eukprot:10413803-Karenia_brevis.AAC.1